MRSRLAAGFGALVVLVVSMAALAPPAAAHPLGNFTVNRYARVEVSAGVVRIYYVLDEAEIPTFQEGAAPKTDPAGFAKARTADLGAHLRLTVDGSTSALTPSVPEMSLPPGQAGLHTLHLSVLFSAPLSGGAADPHTLEFADNNQPDHIGWREIVATARGDAHIQTANAPDHDVSRELTAYPGNLIQSPLDLRRATVTFTAGTQAVAPAPFIVSGRSVVRSGAGFAALINHKKITVVVFLGLLVVAAGFGAVHALAPATARRSWPPTSSAPGAGRATRCCSARSCRSCIRPACWPSAVRCTPSAATPTPTGCTRTSRSPPARASPPGEHG
ncbi:MAG: hypothetical protein NVSMB16_12670 [Acidimicrobiales bacterium]